MIYVIFFYNFHVLLWVLVLSKFFEEFVVLFKKMLDWLLLLYYFNFYFDITRISLG